MMDQWHQGLPLKVVKVLAGLILISILPPGWSVAAQPAPLSVPASARWYGDDGSWSPVDIRVGSPSQWVSVFPNTASQEIWVIGLSGCDATFTCRDDRGGLFAANESSTWQPLGPYELGFDPQFGDSGSGYYGSDQVALNDTFVIPSQVVAVINETEYWLGSMGLGVEPMNFTDGALLTFLSTLVENQSLIPSHSYGYTAGAYYRLKGVPASLTLGGVDENRFQPNDISFQLSPANLPVVALNSISVSANPLTTATSLPNFSNSLALLSFDSSNLFNIDSSTAFLWLPESSCDAFSKALNLTYNDTLQVYTYGTNSSIRDQLISWNLTFTFSVADLPGSSHSINITLPFSAFDHSLSYPFPNLETYYTDTTYNYFPLRKANSTQFTLGRVFLQESYLIVDYERGNFSVSQAKFAQDALTNMNLVGIYPPANSSYTNPSSHTSSLSTAAKVGIGIGSGIAGLLVLIGIAYCIRKRRSHKSSPPLLEDTKKENPEFGVEDTSTSKPELLGDPYQPVEASSESRFNQERFELGSSPKQPVEAPSDANQLRFELCSSPVQPVELPGSEVAHLLSDEPSFESTTTGLHGNDSHAIHRDSTELLTSDTSSLIGQNDGHEHNIHETLNALTSTAHLHARESIATELISPISGSLGQRLSGTELLPGRALSSSDYARTPVSAPSTTSHRSSQQSFHLARRFGSLERTSSRNSRFIEQGLERNPSQEIAEHRPDIGELHTPASPDASNVSPRQRYSWEES